MLGNNRTTLKNPGRRLRLEAKRSEAVAEFETIIIQGAPRLAVSVAGAGELVVMLHGVGGNRRNWSGQIAALAPSFRAVAWDARGYGDSDDYVGAFSFGDVSHDLLRVLGHFGAERAHLVGLSMGGNIAMDFALRYPDRVASLVLADTDRGMRFLPADSREEFLRLRETPILAGVALDEMAGPILENLLAPTPSRRPDGKCASAFSFSIGKAMSRRYARRSTSTSRKNSAP